MKNLKTYNVAMMVLLSLLLGGCAGTKTFHEVARAGDTIAVAAGWKKDFSRDNVRVYVASHSNWEWIAYEPNDPAIRGVINLYPDPLSSLIISKATKQDMTPYAQTYGNVIGTHFTGEDKDWWETTVFVNLPSTLPVGWATVYIENISDPENDFVSADVEIVAGVGRPNSFEAELSGPLLVNHMKSMERVSHKTISFAGSTIPYAIQVTLSHAPDVSNGGSGKTYVVNPRGDVKSASWADDGNTTKVMLTPAKEGQLEHIKDYKFYVAGGITNLQVVEVKAVDSNGNAVAGVTASID